MLKDRIIGIRRRMSNDYIFDEPGEMVVGMDEDMEWALGVIESLWGAVGFFCSVIKSGEPWTNVCQERYDALLQAEKEERVHPMTLGECVDAERKG
ncbi:unnamed protein product [marine sediment metagenome]|uniref:Uncharacterized protein n=1 Tax=marine sediment metagenome TaxID=412755 RepID=X1V8D3_9ZZZZ